MKSVGKILLEVVALIVIATILGFSMNAVRGDSITISRNYFPKSTTVRLPEPKVQPTLSVSSEKPQEQEPSGEPTDPVGPEFESEFPIVEIDEVRQCAEDATMGFCLLIDARDDKHFADGHIPGAIQCDYYRIQNHIDEVLMRSDTAEKIVIYCNGGSCEDSLLLCRALLNDYGVPMHKLFLYAGGWDDWTGQAGG